MPPARCRAAPDQRAARRGAPSVVVAALAGDERREHGRAVVREGRLHVRGRPDHHVLAAAELLREPERRVRDAVRIEHHHCVHAARGGVGAARRVGRAAHRDPHAHARRRPGAEVRGGAAPRRPGLILPAAERCAARVVVRGGAELGAVDEGRRRGAVTAGAAGGGVAAQPAADQLQRGAAVIGRRRPESDGGASVAEPRSEAGVRSRNAGAGFTAGAGVDKHAAKTARQEARQQ